MVTWGSASFEVPARGSACQRARSSLKPGLPPATDSRAFETIPGNVFNASLLDV